MVLEAASEQDLHSVAAKLTENNIRQDRGQKTSVQKFKVMGAGEKVGKGGGRIELGSYRILQP